MLRMNSTSKNFDGTSQIGDDPVVNMNGSITTDNFYVNINATDIATLKANKSDIAADVADFIEAMLE